MISLSLRIVTTVCLCFFGLTLLLVSSRGNFFPPQIKPSDYLPYDEKRAALGRLLFYDKLLSGNRNISCGGCHNHDHATGDGLSLGVGEGGIGIGPDRKFTQDKLPIKRVPRNAPPLFNLGHRDIRVFFHDGRLSIDDIYGNGFNSPAEEWLPSGLTSLSSAQVLFPVASRVEMAGDPHENDIGSSIRERIDFGWHKLSARISSIPEYRRLFGEAYGSDVPIDIVSIANAIGDFVNSEWRSHSSPFDAYIGGDASALTPAQRSGLDIFFGEGRCSTCHSGALLTDQNFYALGVPPLGPGRNRLFDPFPRDVGRMAETDLLSDSYRFRTPMLRNVAHTGPWGHNGAYSTLEGIVRHHLDPLGSLESWRRSEVILPPSKKFQKVDFVVWSDSREMSRFSGRIDIEPVQLSDDEIAALLSFLHALTDESSLTGRLGKPLTVPSGLVVD